MVSDLGTLHQRLAIVCKKIHGLIQRFKENKITHFRAPTIIQDGGGFTMGGVKFFKYFMWQKYMVYGYKFWPKWSLLLIDPNGSAF